MHTFGCWHPQVAELPQTAIRPALIDAAGKALRLEPVGADTSCLIFRYPECLGMGTLMPVCLRLPTASGSLALFVSPTGGLTAVDFEGDVAVARAKVNDVFRMNAAELTSAIALANRRASPPNDFVCDVDPNLIAIVGQNLAVRHASLIVVCGDTDVPDEAMRLPLKANVTVTVVAVQVFKTENNALLACPRILIESHFQPHAQSPAFAPLTHTAQALIRDNAAFAEEAFFLAMVCLHPALPDRLHAFLNRIAVCDVLPVYGRSLSMVWNAPNGQTVRLAHITRMGLVWTDVGLANFPGAENLAHQYVERLASSLGLAVNRTAFGTIWTLRDGRDHLPNIKTLTDRLSVWADALEQLIACLRLAGA